MIKTFLSSFLCCLVLSVHSLKAQDEIKLSDLKTPGSPGFQLLDIAPSNIERPTNPKAFAFGVYNLTSNGTAIPKNFSFEISPYWYTKPSTATVYKYLNIDDGKQKNYFTGIYNKLSFSLASSFSDSTAGSLLKNTNYIAIGARTNLLTIRLPKQNKAFGSALSNISTRMGDLKENKPERSVLNVKLVNALNRLQNETDPGKKAPIQKEIDVIQAAIVSLREKSIEEFEKAVESDEELQKNLKELDAAPLLQIDAAYAYSGAFPGNVYENRRFNRSGFWVNATLGHSFNPGKLEDNLSLTFSFRSMKDNILTDTLKSVFQKKGSLDFGGKLEYSIKKLSFSIEYLRRTYSNADSLNSERTVGVIQYKINDNLYLLGTYGKNFGNYKNLFTLIGLNWGFGKALLNNKK